MTAAEIHKAERACIAIRDACEVLDSLGIGNHHYPAREGSYPLALANIENGYMTIWKGLQRCGS